MAKFIPLKNLVCVVAGGAKGLGRATAELLVKNGAQTIVADLPPPITPKEIAMKIMAAQSDTGGHCIFLPTDITSDSKARATFEEVKRLYGRLDVLVNCAGMASEEMMYNSRTGSVHSLELFQRTLRINLIGTFNMARLAAQFMARNKPDENGLRGVIVNAASVTAYDSPHGFAAYAASKGGVVSMALPMARDLADVGIRVVSIAPGDMDTSVYKGMRQTVRAEGRSRYQQLLGRPGHPEEFAHAVRTVIETPYINACVVRLDGADSSALIH